MIFQSNSKEAVAERQRNLEMQHAERLKALEMGQPLPEVEQLRAKTQRKWLEQRIAAVLFFMILLTGGPIAICGIATGATSSVLHQTESESQRFYVTVIWTCSGMIALIFVAGMVAFGLYVLRPFLECSVASFQREKLDHVKLESPFAPRDYVK